MHFDFSSAIENARFFAARAEALRRNAAHPVTVQPNSGPWSPLPKAGRSGARGRPVSSSVPKVTPFAHAH
jgi:hypothetical protein